MIKDSFQKDSNSIVKVTRVGMYSNIGLSAMKLIVGGLVGSLALVADGLHSLSDLATDLAVIFGTYIGSRPPDRNHPFGHGKFETMSTLIVALVLVISGAWIGWEAISTIKQLDSTPNGWGIILVSGLSIAVKELLYQITVRIAVRTRSQILQANAWHHRSDAFTSVIVLFGGGAALLGWNSGDSAAGLLVGLVVVLVGAKIGFRSLLELSESSAGAEIEDRIETVLRSFRDVEDWHRLRTRQIGRELQMDVHVVLDGNMRLYEADKIADEIEEAIEKELNMPIHITIHMDPDEYKEFSHE